MSDKTKSTTSEVPDQPQPISEGAKNYLANFEPNRTLDPYPMAEITRKLGLTGPRKPASELIDQPFIILGAKPFGSSFDPSREAYFCVCTMQGSGEVFTTVLGGGAVVDLLGAVIRSGFDQPLLVTLRKIEGGRFGRYYVLE